MRPAAAGVRIVLKMLGGGVCRHGPTSLCLSPAQGCARRFVQMQAPAQHCCQLRACMATSYRSNLLDRIGGALAAGPDNAGYRWLGRPILLPAAMQFYDRHT